MRATNLLRIILLASLIAIPATPQRAVSRPAGCAIAPWQSLAPPGVGAVRAAWEGQAGIRPCCHPSAPASTTTRRPMASGGWPGTGGG